MPESNSPRTRNRRKELNPSPSQSQTSHLDPYGYPLGSYMAHPQFAGVACERSRAGDSNRSVRSILSRTSSSSYRPKMG